MLPVPQRRPGSPSDEERLLEDGAGGEGKEEDDLIYTGALDTISQKYESLDYDTNFNSLLLDEIRSRGYRFEITKVNQYTAVH